MEPLATRPHREIVLIAMALVVLVAGFAAWMMFKPSAPDAEARASAAALGLVVAEDVEVESIDGGFRLLWEVAPDVPSLVGPYYFDIVETAEVSVPADLSTWEPKIAGATAYAEGEPPTRVHIDAGARSWIVAAGTPWIYGSDESTRGAWYGLANAISFTSAS
jgi:hypothetical protein